jgi:dTDP-4-amino-4,6-dideoxygalactose transaminase
MGKIDFIDLRAQQATIRDRLDAALARVLDHGAYILGPEVAEFEKKLKDYCGARHALTCANGTDAITLVLMAEGIGDGDTVIVPSFTFIATAEAPAQLSATPYFVDVRRDTFNIDPESAERGIVDAKRRGLKPRAIIAVDLFGQAADYDALRDLAARHDLLLIADAAQSFGGAYHGRRIGTLADYTTTSFFPAKPLGCYGDGGAVFTDDDERAARLASIRNHGKGVDKYDNVRIGLNSRLDTLQAAVLIEKLAIFDGETERRQKVAANYARTLSNALEVPKVAPGLLSVWAQYTVIAEGMRDGLRSFLNERGIPSQVYYPIPMHRQSAYRHYPALPGGLPVSDFLSEHVLSLPFHPYLEPAQQDRIAAAVHEFMASATVETASVAAAAG